MAAPGRTPSREWENEMADIEFELAFALPEGAHDPFELTDAVTEPGFEDAVVGTGWPGVIGVGLETASDHTEAATLYAARAFQNRLPVGSALRKNWSDQPMLQGGLL